jgi:UDP-glucose 4-epimerase
MPRASFGRTVPSPRVVITGGAGFIGSHVADDLQGRAKIVLVDHLRPGNRENVAQALSGGATLVKRDLLRGDLRPIFRGASLVYHFAANPDVRLGDGGAGSQVEQNVVMTARILEACRATRVPRLVFASTSTVYGEARTVPTPEDYAPLEPISLYGATKLASEALVSAYAHSSGLQAVIFRLANVVGGRSGHGVVHDLVAKLRKDPKHLEIIGSDPGTAKSYVYIEDVLAGFRIGIEKARDPLTVYNLGTEDAISVREIADIVCAELGLDRVEYQWTGGAGQGRGWVGDVRKMSLAIGRLKSAGWRPMMTSAQAVARAAEDAWDRAPRPAKPAR